MVPPPRRPTALGSLSRLNLATVLLLYLTSLHLIGLYTFTRGFLLTRLSIPLTSPPYTSTPPIKPTHHKAIILVIDALRTDFISPHYPSPKSPNHHGVLRLPSELSAAQPANSLMYNTYSDPPTTTMQRIKGITTGSLPTFMDAGANFASTAIEEDNLIHQLKSANRTLAFMGDDTWTNLFPGAFDMAFPYDSFNVEDLHSVDDGVVEHLFPLIGEGGWDVLIGHFLGVDHVGHRVGPERDTMKAKLEQMDTVLRRVVREMDDDTLLVVLGDHGMDSKGNHGGDSELETAAALWFYSKTPFATATSSGSPIYTFPGSSTAIRHVDQIDLVPTLSFMLGVPIPFNNLGSVIPECFDDATLETATRMNAEQIKRYIGEYGDESIGRSIAEVSIDTSTDERSIATHREVAQTALAKLRALWAKFSLTLILLGATLLGLNIPTLLALYIGVRSGQWETYVRVALETAFPPSAILGVVAGLAGWLVDGKTAVQAALVAFALASEVLLTLPLLVIKPRGLPTFSLQRWLGPIIMCLHALSLASNSFIQWEDRTVVFLCVTPILLSLVKSLTAPTAPMRIKLIILSLAISALTRLAGAVTICREEQQPYCRVTFFSGSTPASPAYALIAMIPLALNIPRMISFLLRRSKSLAGPARPFLHTIRVALLLNSVYWIFEWAITWPGLQPARIPLVTLLKLIIARISFAILPALGVYLLRASLCIKTHKQSDGVQVFGFANAYGSTYLLFLLLPFSAVHLVSQPMAQLTLTSLLISILLYIELIDTQRDALIIQRSFANSASPGAFDGSPSGVIIRPSFSDLIPLALMGYVGFFSTGHQAVLTSIQWKAAFVGFSTVTYPYSPLLVIINTWGPLLLPTLAIPLLAIWNISPRPSSSIPILAHTLQLSLAYMTYHTCITFASAVFSAVLRRHLMVWKVFAPRFMLAGVTLLLVDLGLLLGLQVVGLTGWKVWRTFRCVSG